MRMHEVKPGLVCRSAWCHMTFHPDGRIMLALSWSRCVVANYWETFNSLGEAISYLHSNCDSDTRLIEN